MRQDHRPTFTLQPENGVDIRCEDRPFHGRDHALNALIKLGVELSRSRHSRTLLMAVVVRRLMLFSSIYRVKKRSPTSGLFASPLMLGMSIRGFKMTNR
jgi:hypothetical protein